MVVKSQIQYVQPFSQLRDTYWNDRKQFTESSFDAKKPHAIIRDSIVQVGMKGNFKFLH